jgi:hypothetical protein
LDYSIGQSSSAKVNLSNSPFNASGKEDREVQTSIVGKPRQGMLPQTNWD